MKIEGTEHEKQRVKNLLIRDCETQIVGIAAEIRFATGASRLNIKEVKSKIYKIKSLLEEIDLYECVFTTTHEKR